MTQRSVTHASFVVERNYPVSPAKVFAAFADPKLKARWFAGPEEWNNEVPEFDFRVGGREITRGGPNGGPVHTFEAYYHDIVPDERIVYSYAMYTDDTRISVSLATIQIKPEGTGTKLTFTEQGAFLDGFDNPVEREHGTGELLTALAVALNDK
jgi:uncharacterized protein YndB with AHSA1/START domain